MKWARLHPVLAAIRARAGNHRLVLCCGCEERTARVGALCRSCAKKWDKGGWAALDFQPPGWRGVTGEGGGDAPCSCACVNHPSGGCGCPCARHVEAARDP